jgi:hypothetical protein
MTKSKKLFLGGKHYKGGACTDPTSSTDYGSAGNYALNTVGSGDQQWNDTFQQVSGVSNNGFPGSSNALRSLSGQILGGSRRSKRGGNILPAVLNEAAVPLSLLAMQQSYNSKKKGGNHAMLAEAAVPLSLLALQQSYGKKKGGNAMLADAAVPLSLLALQQSYGKKKGGTKKRRGGNAMLADAAVPLSLLALQQSYGKKKGGTKKRRGGNAMLAQAALPLSLLALQQNYGKKNMMDLKSLKDKMSFVKGGNASMLAEAATPLSLLALQQSYGKKSGKNKTFKKSRFSRRR